jgi:hypothetical protein
MLRFHSFRPSVLLSVLIDRIHAREILRDRTLEDKCHWECAKYKNSISQWFPLVENDSSTASEEQYLC